MFDMSNYWVTCLDLAAILPAGFLCFTPMKNQLRYGVKKTVQVVAPLLIILVFFLSWLTCMLDVAPSTMVTAFFLVFFVIFHGFLTVPVYKSLAVFAYVLVVMVLVAHFTIVFDAIIHPDGGANIIRWEGALFQLVMSVLLVGVICYPVGHLGCVIIDDLNQPRAWLTMLSLSLLFLTAGIVIRPIHYQTLYMNQVFVAYVIVILMLFVTSILLSAIFYFIVSSMNHEKEVEERNRILEMQEAQYIKQKEYMKMSAATRHDFRQTIRTLENLMRDENYEAAKELVEAHAERLPQSDMIDFCDNHAVNALLNYYYEVAEEGRIETDWETGVPEDIRIKGADLCSIIGNLVENAIAACRELPEEERYIDLSISVAGTNLCIVMTNPFAGSVRKVGEHYQSTHRNGSGIGLSSVASIAEKYAGVAKFSHSDKSEEEGTGEFYSDVMVRL